jgi:hypothetical protein
LIVHVVPCITVKGEDSPVQTFLPYADFRRSAAILDSKRLGKQRVETLQIVQVLLELRWDNSRGEIEAYQPKGWRTHPAVLMWRGHEAALLDYQAAVCEEWSGRGFKDTCLAKSVGLFQYSRLGSATEVPPPWIGQPELHRSHQSNLIRKDPEFYGPVFSGVPPDLPYIWPVTVG